MLLTEDQLHREIRRLFGGHQGLQLSGFPRVVLRLGVDALDDAAVIDVGGASLVLSTDFVRGEGFNLFKKGLLNRYDTGYYLAVANLSDIAAMGVRPSALLVAVRHTKESGSQVLSVLRGIRDACKVHEVVVVGGDSGTYDRPVLTATAIGFAPRGQYLTRAGAQPGDKIFMSGFAGYAGTALFYFMQKAALGLKLSRREETQLVRTWRRPRAFAAKAASLARAQSVHSAQDISDGLQRTIEQMSRASDVRFCLVEDQLPIHPTTRKVAAQAGIPATTLALSDSVDFGLVVTSSKLPPSLRSEFTEIGLVAKGHGSVIADANGRHRALDGVPWTQQVEDITKVIRATGSHKRGRSTRRP